MIVIALIGTELGYMFYMKREFQKTADLAALAGAQKFVPSPGADTCQDAKNAATANAAQNLQSVTLTILECGRWAPEISSDDHFAPGGTDYNALRVTITAEPPMSLVPFFGGNRTISVKAVAALDVSAAMFSVGSQLLRTNGNAPLGKLLQAIGLNPEALTVLDSEGLAKIKVTPAGLFKALGLDVNLEAGVLTPEAIAAIPEVSLGGILDAALGVITQDDVAEASLGLLRQELVRLDLSEIDLKLLGSSESNSGLLRLNAPDASNSAALNTEIDLGTLLKTGIAIASKDKRGIAIPELNLLGLVDVQAGIVEPPSIGIGGVHAKAYNAQIRLYIDVDSDNLLGGILTPLISTLLGTRVHLPIYLDAINGYGEITDLDCQAVPPTATIQVSSSILRACVGKVNDAAVRFSDKNLCEDSLQPERLIELLHLPVPAATTIQFNALVQEDTLTLTTGETKSTPPNKTAIGSLISNLVAELLDTLDQLLNPTTSGVSQSDRAAALASSYLDATKKQDGFYDAVAVVNKLKIGGPGAPSLGDWNRTVWVQDPIVGLFPYQKTMSVWEVLALQTQPSGGLLGLVGLGQSCASLLQSLLDWNGCVRSKVVDALNSAPPNVIEAVADQIPESIPSGSGNLGLLSALLTPVVALLEPLLNSIGTLLSSLLANVLGLELGRTDVTLHELQCGRSKLVF